LFKVVDQEVTVVSAVLLLYEHWRRSEFPVLKSVGEEVVMFTRSKRQGWLNSTLRFVPVIAVAAAAMIAMAPTDARAQANNVNIFECADSGGVAVRVDVTGLGNGDLCVVADITEEVDCACVGGGGNCTSDAKKETSVGTITAAQKVEAKNGRVDTTVTPTVPTPSCAAPQCGSGQTTTLIQFSAVGDFRVCTLGPGVTCSAANCPENSANVIATADACGPANTIVFRGKKDSCVDLFP
jgi:hypothetical protein